MVASVGSFEIDYSPGLPTAVRGGTVTRLRSRRARSRPRRRHGYGSTCGATPVTSRTLRRRRVANITTSFRNARCMLVQPTPTPRIHLAMNDRSTALVQRSARVHYEGFALLHGGVGMHARSSSHRRFRPVQVSMTCHLPGLNESPEPAHPRRTPRRRGPTPGWRASRLLKFASSARRPRRACFPSRHQCVTVDMATPGFA